MLRNRILAAATAAVLMFGMSVGGAGAAFAKTVDPGDGGGGGTSTADSPCDFEAGFGSGTKIAPGEAGVPVSGSETYEWGTLTWSQNQLVFTAAPGWTVDLCVKGGSQEMNSIVFATGSVTIDRVQSISHFMWANPVFTAPVASASITANPRNCESPTTWNFATDAISNATWGEPFVVDGQIKIVATATGGALFAGNLTTMTFTAPYEAAGGEDCGELTTVTPDASVGQISCLNDVLVGGIITVDLTRSGVSYSIEDADGNPVAFDAMTGKTVALEPGDYTVYGVDADAADLFDVSDYSQTFTVDEFDGECGEPTTVTPDASVEQISCPNDVLVGGIITVDLTRSGVLYSIEDADGNPVAFNATTGKTVALEPGDYTVYGVDADAEDLFDVSDYSDEFTVDEFDGACGELLELMDWPAAASSSPQDCVTGELVDGTIDVVFPEGTDENPNPIRYYAYNGDSEVELTEASTPLPAGTYVVTAVATDPNDKVNGSDDPVKFTVTVGEYNGVCLELSTSANWPASASGSAEECAVTGTMTSGAITVQFSTGPADNPNPVRYYVAYGTPQQKELVDAVTSMAPGSYVVTAVATVPADSLNDAGNTAQLTVNVGAASDEQCDELETLAFTGASAFTEWLGVAAVLMMVAGMGFVVRRNRVEV